MADWYVHPSGLDTNAGTQASPKRTFNGAASATAFAANDRILLANGYCHPPRNGFFTVITKSNVVIIGYDSGEGLSTRPLMDCLYYENSIGSGGWTHEGDANSAYNGIWSKVIGSPTNTTQTPKRIWTGCVNNGLLRTQRTVGTARRRVKDATTDTLASIAANLNATDIWYSAGSALSYKTFIYTGSTTVAPPQFYNGLAMCANDGTTIGAGNVFTFRACDSCLIDGIDVRGAQVGLRYSSNTSDTIPCTNHVARNMFMSHFQSAAAISQPSAENNALPRVEISGIRWYDLIGDSGTSAEEQEPTTLYSKLSGAMDIFQFIDTSRDCWAYRCTAINSFHAGFVIGASTLNSLVTDNCGFIDCKMYADPWTTYARGANSYNCTESCGYIRCTFEGQCIQSQFSGSPLIDKCRWYNMHASARKPDFSGWVGFQAGMLKRTYPNAGDDQYVKFEPFNVRIRDCVVVDPYSYPILMETFNAENVPNVSEPIIRPGSVHIENTVVLDRVRGGAPSIFIENRSSVVGVQNISFNCIYTGSGNPAPTVANKTGGATTTSALNVAPGTALNITVDPLLDVSDPLSIKMAGNSPLMRAGTLRNRGVDRNKPMISRPHIGPFLKSNVF